LKAFWLKPPPARSTICTTPGTACPALIPLVWSAVPVELLTVTLE
jgi:hypothetical protein